jgi:hypothetical protein
LGQIGAEVSASGHEGFPSSVSMACNASATSGGDGSPMSTRASSSNLSARSHGQVRHVLQDLRRLELLINRRVVLRRPRGCPGDVCAQGSSYTAPLRGVLGLLASFLGAALQGLELSLQLLNEGGVGTLVEALHLVGVGC